LRLTAFAAFLAVVAGLYRGDEKREGVLEAQLTDKRREKLDLDLVARGREGLLEEVRFLRERMLKGKGGKDGKSSKSSKDGKSSNSSRGGGSKKFDISDCSTYQNEWLEDLATSCKKENMIGCECKRARRMVGLKKLKCSAACPKDCSVCDFCMDSIRC